MIYLPSEIKSSAELYRENPKLKDFAKRFNLSRFVDIGFVVFSQPQGHPDITIYGLFVIDKANVEKNLRNASSSSEIAQDFIAYDRTSSCYVYYSGQGKHDAKVEHQHINLFCKKFGKGPDGEAQYGCSQDLKIAQHRYRNENDSNLPQESWIKDLIGEKMKEVRASY